MEHRSQKCDLNKFLFLLFTVLPAAKAMKKVPYQICVQCLLKGMKTSNIEIHIILTESDYGLVMKDVC